MRVAWNTPRAVLKFMNLTLGPGFNGSRIFKKNGRICVAFPCCPFPENSICNFWDNDFQFFKNRSSEGKEYEWATEYKEIAKLTVSGISVGVENLNQEKLRVCCKGKESKMIFANNTLANLHIQDTGEKTVLDFQRQEWPAVELHSTPTTKLLFSRTGPPLCFVCQDQNAAKLFAACGHWGICTECEKSNSSKCPICRQESNTRSLFVV